MTATMWSYDETGIAHFTGPDIDDGDVIMEDSTDPSPDIDWLAQLNAFASSPTTEQDIIQTHSSTETQFMIDSETDFLESPCGRFSDPIPPIFSVTTKNRGKPIQRRKSVVQPNLPVRRKLDYQSTIRTPSTGILSENSLSLNKLKLIEYSPPHQWSDSQRSFLSALYHLFEPDYPLYTKLFNSFHGLSLSVNKIRSQVSHLNVFYTAFSRIHGDIQAQVDMWTSITTLCRKENVQLVPRITALTVGVNKRTAQRTQRRLKTLVRQASDKNTNDLTTSVDPQVQTRNFAVYVDEDLEQVVDIESTDPHGQFGYSKSHSSPFSVGFGTLTSEHSSLSPASLSTGTMGLVPGSSIAFRVWDNNSATSYSSTRGFTAALFSSDWTQAMASPDLSINDQMSLQAKSNMSAIQLWARSHLSMTSRIPSPFISCCTSLVQVFKYASTMDNPMLAVIDLSKIKQCNVVAAKTVLENLKAQNQATWARYKAIYEKMCYGNIPAEALISVTPYLSLIKSLPGIDWTVFDGRPTGRVVKALSTHKVTIEKIAHELGYFTRVLLGGLEHIGVIPSVVRNVIEGFGIIASRSEEDRNWASTQFTRAFLNGDYQYHAQVAEAFLHGVELAEKCWKPTPRKRANNTNDGAALG
ncbi:unnamed protein product [Periconia digitata]|uniref:DUF7587 domain-containing protein n=1 Tax=Periconia digitata TaxID=1303443 RepID=A0A9W4UM16_9PLEO|nr:unnamed protein product [Periconia digitata]